MIIKLNVKLISLFIFLLFSFNNSKFIHIISYIFSKIEEEFGRTLSPIEYETIKRWLDSNMKEELIVEALKEAVLNGVYNIKYIDKILYDWGKKGYINASDVKKKKEVSEEEVKVFSYDWLDDDE